MKGDKHASSSYAKGARSGFNWKVNWSGPEVDLQIGETEICQVTRNAKREITIVVVEPM